MSFVNYLHLILLTNGQTFEVTVAQEKFSVKYTADPRTCQGMSACTPPTHTLIKPEIRNLKLVRVCHPGT